jgi:hypothetical protein
MKIVTASTCFVALLTWASASQSACPTNYVKLFGTESFPTSPSFDDPHAKYDLLAGTIYSHTNAGWYSFSQTVVQANDEYWLEGPASGIPISFSATLHLTGTAERFDEDALRLHVVRRLRLGERCRHAVCRCRRVRLLITDQTITLSLQRLPGEVFPLTMKATAGANGDESSLNGVLTFSIPPQYGIRSC